MSNVCINHPFICIDTIVIIIGSQMTIVSFRNNSIRVINIFFFNYHIVNTTATISIVFIITLDDIFTKIHIGLKNRRIHRHIRTRIGFNMIIPKLLQFLSCSSIFSRFKIIACVHHSNRIIVRGNFEFPTPSHPLPCFDINNPPRTSAQQDAKLPQ